MMKKASYDLPFDAYASGRILSAVFALLTVATLIVVGVMHVCAVVIDDWRGQLASQITIEVMPANSRDAFSNDQSRDLANKIKQVSLSFAEVLDVEEISKARMASWLEPWLGAGNVIDDLPIPILFAITVKPGKKINLVKLRASIHEFAPDARIEDHQAWFSATLDKANVLLHISHVFILIFIITSALVIALSAHQALAIHRESLLILSLVGATPSYIARQFQRHGISVTLKGIIAGFFTFLLISLSMQAALPENIQSFFQQSFKFWPWMIIVLVIIAGMLATVSIATFMTVHYILRKQAYFDLQ